MNRSLSVILFWAALSVLLVSPAVPAAGVADDTAGIIAIGKHPISGNNTAKAREAAITDALAGAVEQGVLSRLDPSEIASSLPLLMDVLTADPHDHVITFKVLGEDTRSGQVVTVVEATLDSAMLASFSSRYQAPRASDDLPGLLVFMSEQVPGDILPRYWWGNNPLPYRSTTNDAFIQSLSPDTVNVLDRVPSAQLKESGIEFEYIHDTDTALRAAETLGADIMVMAKVQAEEASNVMGQEKAYRSTLFLEAYDVASSDRITDFSTDAVIKSDIPQVGIEKSLAQVGILAADRFMNSLNTAWTGGRSGPRAIETRIEGEDYLSSFIMLRKVLNSMTGIQEIQTRELSTDNAIVEILYQGNGKKLADALMLQSFDAFNLDLSNISDTTLNIRFIPKNGEDPLSPRNIEGALISE